MLSFIDWRFKFGLYDRAQVSSIATIHPRKSSPLLWYWCNKACVTAQWCHCCTLEISWVSSALQVCGNPECCEECGAQFCDILRLLLLTHAQSICDHHPTGEQGLELCCSPHGVILYGCPKWHSCLPRMLQPIMPLYDMAMLHRHMPHAVPENILVYYDLMPLQI